MANGYRDRMHSTDPYDAAGTALGDIADVASRDSPFWDRVLPDEIRFCLGRFHPQISASVAACPIHEKAPTKRSVLAEKTGAKLFRGLQMISPKAQHPESREAKAQE